MTMMLMSAIAIVLIVKWNSGREKQCGCLPQHRTNVLVESLPMISCCQKRNENG